MFSVDGLLQGLIQTLETFRVSKVGRYHCFLFIVYKYLSPPPLSLCFKQKWMFTIVLYYTDVLLWIIIESQFSVVVKGIFPLESGGMWVLVLPQAQFGAFLEEKKMPTDYVSIYLPGIDIHLMGRIQKRNYYRFNLI